MYPLQPISHLYKQIILINSIVEVLLGLTNIGIGATFVFESTHLTAIWITGGIWIVITGFIGIFSGSRTSNACWVNAHMSFCISSSLGSCGLAFIGFYIMSSSSNQLFPTPELISWTDTRVLALSVMDCFVALFCTISGSFCCALNSSFGYSGACGGCICVSLEQSPQVETDQSAVENVPRSLPYNNTHLIPRITQIKYETNQA